MKCKSGFGGGSPESPVSETLGAGTGCAAPRELPPGTGCGPRPAPRAPPLRPGRPRRAWGRSPAPPGVRSERWGLRPRRGFKCTPGSEPAGLGARSPLLRPWSAVPGARGSRDPTPPPSRPCRPAGQGRKPERTADRHSARSPSSPLPGPTAGQPPKSNVEAPPGKEVGLPLHAAPSGIWNRQEIVRTRSLRLRSQLSLCWKEAAPTKVLPPPPPESPAQVCKEGCEIWKVRVLGRKMSVTVPNQRWGLSSCR